MESKEQATNANASGDSPGNPSSAVRTVQERIIKDVSVALRWLELCLATVSIIVVIVGICFLLGQLVHFWDNLSNTSLQVTFVNVLADILLLVVGVELAIMLVRRRPEDLVDIIFFVIARKMVIRTGEFYELLIGVAALAGVFAIRKYLTRRPRPQASDQ